MLKYMLDTDTVSFAIRGEGRVGARLLKERPSQVCISAITLAELRYGAAKRGSRKLSGLIDRFTVQVQVMPFDASAAARYGKLAAALADGGVSLSSFDAMIAAHALSEQVTLVSHNIKHFGRVRGLKLESWK